jgi:hypothetical protein
MGCEDKSREMQKIEAKKADEEENGDSRGSRSASFDGSLDPGRKAESQAKVGKIACFAQTYTVNGLGQEKAKAAQKEAQESESKA